MLNRRQTSAILLLACLAVGLAWLGRASSQYPIQNYTSAAEKDNQKSTSGSSTDLLFGYSALDIFTGLLAFATVILAFIACRQVRDSRIVQRAYVKMSHQPPGINFIDDQEMELKIEIRNSGQTPVRITDVVICCHTQPKDETLPARPPYKRLAGQGTSAAFLVRDDYFFVITRIAAEGKEAQQVREARKGDYKLFILGYVDYVDKFGQRHRGGYARLYEPRMDERGDRTDVEFAKRNNLIFVTAPGYNYDRVRLPKEGND